MFNAPNIPFIFLFFLYTISLGSNLANTGTTSNAKVSYVISYLILMGLLYFAVAW